MPNRLVKWIKESAAKARRTKKIGSARSWLLWFQLLAAAAQVAQFVNDVTGGGL